MLISRELLASLIRQSFGLVLKIEWMTKLAKEDSARMGTNLSSVSNRRPGSGKLNSGAKCDEGYKGLGELSGRRG
jgi:hypothetical protein